ncbi:E3 ubiquitin-protein ligase TRAIP [Liparis tanakae]|uniref:E3 ubiquitin-protein ligase TRAIP n=1 Tax=Liparis tanakae TaxID=230148 RepID=A0A4Z2HP40_9TELE|nr:E3 ubiquitin-protein ligase TRAIP [Liparis tanakae]
MPIRAYCTICSDFFDHYRDVAAIHCGHTFHYECLLQWFQTAPTKTCPQCRKQVSTKHIINKLYFDIGGEEEGATKDPEILQNDLDRMKALLSSKEREWRDKQTTVDKLKDVVDKQKRDLDGVRKDIVEKEMLCSSLRKQMTYLETQQNETQAAKEETRRLRTRVKTFESLEVLLHGQRAEVESMIMDMGVSQAAVEQLSIYCISLKKEYDNLKGSLKSTNDLSEKLKREVLTSNNKLHKATVEVNRTREDVASLQRDLVGADKEISLRGHGGGLHHGLEAALPLLDVLLRVEDDDVDLGDVEHAQGHGGAQAHGHREGGGLDEHLQNRDSAVPVPPRRSGLSTRRMSPTFSVDCAVPKKMGTKASQMMQVVYMVKPMGLASLKVSGTPRLLMAYTVHVIISTKL